MQVYNNSICSSVQYNIIEMHCITIILPMKIKYE